MTRVGPDLFLHGECNETISVTAGGSEELHKYIVLSLRTSSLVSCSQDPFTRGFVGGRNEDR